MKSEEILNLINAFIKYTSEKIFEKSKNINIQTVDDIYKEVCKDDISYA